MWQSYNRYIALVWLNEPSTAVNDGIGKWLYKVWWRCEAYLYDQVPDRIEMSRSVNRIVQIEHERILQRRKRLERIDRFF